MRKQETSWPYAEIVIKARHARTQAIAATIAEWIVAGTARFGGAFRRGAASTATARPGEHVARFVMPADLMQDVGR